MMRSMRASAKWIMVVVALAFFGWMIFSVGMDLTGRSSGGLTDEAVSVNGQGVTLQQFYQAVRNAQEQQRLSGQPAPSGIEDQRALEDAVFEQLVQQLLLQQEYDKRGIRVGDDELRRAILNVPPEQLRDVEQFKTDGQFDLQKYQNYLRSGADPGLTQAIEAQYREQIPRLKLFEQLTEGLYVSDAELWQRYRDQHETVAARVLVLLPQAAVRASTIDVTDDDARAYYDAHQDELKRPARAFTSFVAVSRVPNAADSAAALERARQLRRQIVAGTDFAEVAKRESADSASRDSGGDLGDVTPGTLVPSFERAALALRPGQISAPVLTPYGYHLIRLESKSGDTYHPSHILIPIEPQGTHLDRIDAQADTLDLLAAEASDPTVLDSVAAQLDLTVGTAPPISRGDHVQLGRSSIPDAGVWAFDAVPGATSPVIEASDAYYVFRLDSLTPEGIPPFDAVRQEVRDRVVLERQWTRVREMSQAIANAVRGGATLEAAARAQSPLLRPRQLEPFTRLQPGPALADAPEAVGLAFGLPVGTVGGPVETDNAIFFVEPTAHQAADSAAFETQKDALRRQVMAGLQDQRLRTILASLRKQADIQDNRRALEQAQEQLAENPPVGSTRPGR